MWSFVVCRVGLLLLAQAPTGPAAPAGLPPILEQALAQRTGFQTAMFDWRIEARRAGQPVHVTRYSVCVSQGKLLMTDLGDDDGVMFREAGSLRPSVGAASAFHPVTHYFDKAANSTWSHTASAYFVKEGPCRSWRAFVDPRTPGMRSVEYQHADPQDIASNLRSSQKLTFTVTKKSDTVDLVLARGTPPATGRAYEYEWEIDKSKGPAIVASREFLASADDRRELASEAITRLEKIDGVWWPVEVVRTSHPTGAQTVFSYSGLEFNRPTHPQQLTPDSLGIPFGTEVKKVGHKGSLYFTGGSSTIDQAEWDQIKDKVELSDLKQFRARMDALGTGQYPDWWDAPGLNLGLSGVEDRPDLWEAYVRRWVLKHMPTQAHVIYQPLAPEQRTAAQGVLDDCRRKATPIRMKQDAELARVKSELDTTAKQAEAKKTPEESPEQKAQSEAKLAALRTRHAELEKSPEIQRIFVELKRRLDNLRTSGQATAVGTGVPAQPKAESLGRPSP